MKKYFLIALALIPICANGMGLAHLNLTMEGIEYQRKALEKIKKMVNEHVSKKLCLDSGEGAINNRLLHNAVSLDKTGFLAQQLLEAGANPNVTNANEETPLHMACGKYSPSNIQLLLKYGGNPNSLSSYESLNTPLQLTFALSDETSGKIGVALLLAYGANPLIKNGFKQNIFQTHHNLTLLPLLKRIFHHKKQAYLWLLKGKSDKSESEFRRLPTDIVRKIVDSIQPGYKDFPWPKEPIPTEKMVKYLESIPE